MKEGTVVRTSRRFYDETIIVGDYVKTPYGLGVVNEIIDKEDGTVPTLIHTVVAQSYYYPLIEKPSYLVSSESYDCIKLTPEFLRGELEGMNKIETNAVKLKVQARETMNALITKLEKQQ